MKNLASTKGFLVGLFVFAVLLFVPTMTAKAAPEDEMQAVAGVFDATYYAANYPDVVATQGQQPLALLKHYYYYGINEGRNASATFNASDYRAKNPDLAAAYGDNMIAYVAHYVRSGRAEGRDATPINVGVVPAEAFTLLGSYTTEYVSTAARATNIQVAARNLNGTVLAPGQTFSASNAFKPRSSANGYVTAPVFINKQHAMGIGGGVCQVSSTTYAAMRVAGIPATERHPHSLPVTYLPAGWDATISAGSLDLKFVNTFSNNLLIDASADQGQLTVAIYLQN